MAITALPTAGRFPVRRKRPNRPAVDNASRRPWCPCNGVRFSHPLLPPRIMHTWGALGESA
jgi:hypothetical protein